MQKGVQHRALAAGARVIVADFADARVGQGLHAVEVYAIAIGRERGDGVPPRLKAFPALGDVSVDLAELFFRHRDIDAAHRVDDGRERKIVHRGVLGDVHAVIFVDGAHHQFRPAVGVGGVQLALAMAGDGYPSVAQQTGELDLAPAKGGDDDGIRALGAVGVDIHAQEQDIGIAARQVARRAHGGTIPEQAHRIAIEQRYG